VSAGNELWYLYGVVRTGDLECIPQTTGVGGRPTTAISAGTLTAVVSRHDRSGVRATRADLLAHSDVLQSIVDCCDVLPVGFGNLYQSDDQIRRDLLEGHGRMLSRMLDDIRDAVEVQVKATYDEDAVVSEVVGTDRRLQRMRNKPGHDAQVEVGRRFAELLDARRSSDAARLLKRAGRVARKTAFGQPSGDFGVVNASCLVRRADVTTFVDEVQRAADAMPAVAVRTVGPMPPYDFVGALDGRS
jgi:hypothetical protein